MKPASGCREVAEAEVEVARAQLELERSLVKAPINGIIMQLNVRQGSLVGGRPTGQGPMDSILTLYDPRRAQWDIDGPTPNLSGSALTPKTLPGFASWQGRAHAEVRQQACIHCHQVAEILRQPAVEHSTLGV